MYAKKCDRCGKLYECEEPKLMKIGKVTAYGIAWEIYGNNCFIDLCPDCLNDFKKWFERKE